MITGNWGFILNLLSMAALLGLASVAFQLLTAPLLIRAGKRVDPLEQKWLILSWALLPWAMTLLLLVQGGIALPDDHNTVYGSLRLIHWHHADEFVVSAWHGWLLSAVGLWLTLRIGRFAYQQWRVNQHLKLLREQALATSDSTICILPTHDVVAMTAGYFRTDIYLSQGLLNQTTPDQQAIIIAHEQAHIRQFDNLSRWLLMLLICPLPGFVRTPILNRFTLVTEQLADRRVTRNAEAADIAETLVKIARLRHRTNNLGLAAFIDAGQLRERVCELLAPSRPSALKLGLLPLAILVTATAVLSATDALHHFFDIFLVH
jgi:hypothetical protein